MLDDTHFLYVEDDPLSIEVMTITMTTVMNVPNYHVFEHTENFMARLQQLPQKPHVFMLDIHMNPLNGFDLLQMIRNTPAYDTSIIIALTASVMSEEVNKLQESGFDGAISKPLDIESFPNLLQRVVNGESVWHITS